MRSRPASSELGRLAAPILRFLDGAWRRMHWWIAVMAILYGSSGITVILPDEVAIVLRWGRLVGATPLQREHGPGLLFAFPKPIDQVVRVQTRRVRERSIDLLADTRDWGGNEGTLDPLAVGYALSGDENVVHVAMMVRYRVRDPVEWAFYGPRSEDVLRAEVTAAMGRSLGEMAIDRVLADGRKDLVATATRRAQIALDQAHSGLELLSLELKGLGPPRALAQAFDEVQSAYIEAETKQKEARAFAQEILPRAQAEVNAALQGARADAASARARADGSASAFLALEEKYKADPVVVRERLYRDAVENAIAGAQGVRWIPPPAKDDYQGMRVMLTPQPAGVGEPGTAPAEKVP